RHSRRIWKRRFGWVLGARSHREHLTAGSQAAEQTLRSKRHSTSADQKFDCQSATDLVANVSVTGIPVSITLLDVNVRYLRETDDRPVEANAERNSYRETYRVLHPLRFAVSARGAVCGCAEKADPGEGEGLLRPAAADQAAGAGQSARVVPDPA